MSWIGPLMGVSIATATWLHYLASIPKEKVPAKPTLHIAALTLASATAIAPMAFGRIPTPLTYALVGATWGLSGFFLYLLSQAPLPDGEIQVKVGGKMLDFQAVDAKGAPFSLSNLQGKRYLMKFFRGHW